MFLKKFKTSITCVSRLMRRNNGSENLNSLIIVLPTLVLYFISFGKKKWWSVINGMNDIQSWICYVGWYHLSRILHLRFFSHNFSPSDISFIWRNDGLCNRNVDGSCMWDYLLDNIETFCQMDKCYKGEPSVSKS